MVVLLVGRRPLLKILGRLKAPMGLPLLKVQPERMRKRDKEYEQKEKNVGRCRSDVEQSVKLCGLKSAIDEITGCAFTHGGM